MCTRSLLKEASLSHLIHLLSIIYDQVSTSMIELSSINNHLSIQEFEHSFHQGDPLVLIEGFKLCGSLLLNIHPFPFKSLASPRSLQDWCWRSKTIDFRHPTSYSTFIWSIYTCGFKDSNPPQGFKNKQGE